MHLTLSRNRALSSVTVACAVVMMLFLAHPVSADVFCEYAKDTGTSTEPGEGCYPTKSACEQTVQATCSCQADEAKCAGAQAGGPALTEHSNVFKPLGDTSIPKIVGRVIKTALGLSGVFALLMFVWGGLQWMTAGGNVERVGKARKTIIWATLGLIMIFASYSIVDLIIKAIG